MLFSLFPTDHMYSLLQVKVLYSAITHQTWLKIVFNFQNWYILDYHTFKFKDQYLNILIAWVGNGPTVTNRRADKRRPQYAAGAKFTSSAVTTTLWCASGSCSRHWPASFLFNGLDPCSFLRPHHPSRQSPCLYLIESCLFYEEWYSPHLLQAARGSHFANLSVQEQSTAEFWFNVTISRWICYVFGRRMQNSLC